MIVHVIVIVIALVSGNDAVDVDENGVVPVHERDQDNVDEHVDDHDHVAVHVAGQEDYRPRHTRILR